MAGTRTGGRKAAVTSKRLHGEDFFKVQGSKGGRASNTGGFASKKVGSDGLTGQERARLVGVKGGRISRRRKPVAAVQPNQGANE